jgi:hypothetical protein
MGEVYRNVLCNLAATAAVDGRTCCFLERDIHLARTCKIKISEELPRASLEARLYELIDQVLLSNNVDDTPLNKRAWVLQERIMAQRILHFGKNQLFWECEMVSLVFPLICLSKWSLLGRVSNLSRILNNLEIRASKLSRPVVTSSSTYGDWTVKVVLPVQKPAHRYCPRPSTTSRTWLYADSYDMHIYSVFTKLDMGPQEGCYER